MGQMRVEKGKSRGGEMMTGMHGWRWVETWRGELWEWSDYDKWCCGEGGGEREVWDPRKM